MKTGPTWIVAADGGAARFFVQTRSGVKLAELGDLALKAAPAPAPRDRPARVHDRMGPARHAVAPRATPRAAAETRFLKQVAEQVNLAAQEGAFERLVLCAPPHALGLLRAHLSEGAKARLRGALFKDVLAETPAQINERLRDILR